MSVITSLLGLKVPAWAYEALIVVLVALGLVAYGAHKEKVRIETRVEKQIQIVKENVIVTDHSHDKELSDLRAYRAAHPVAPADVSLCVAGNDLSQGPAQGQGSAQGEPIQPVSPGDSGVREVRTGRPIGGMLDALAGAADEVSATLRRRQTLEP